MKQKEFPTAQEMAGQSAERWEEKSLDDIFEEIFKESSKGGRCVYFFKSKMSEETERTLKKLKYRCDSFVTAGTPGFKISW